MILTIEQVWDFIETTFVHGNAPLRIIDPLTRTYIDEDVYLLKNCWEYRYDISKLKLAWQSGCTFVVISSNISPELRETIQEIENDNNVQAQAHVYMGKKNSKSFEIHADKPDNLMIQCVGKSRVTVYNEYATDLDIDQFVSPNDVTIKDQYILEPGNTVYVPSMQYHLFEPLTDRLSISVPMIRR